MDSRFCSLFLPAVPLAVICALVLQVSAQRLEFISLDCGGQSTGKYNDSNGIEWDSDSNWISLGSSANIRGADQTGLTKPLTTLRYFPAGSLEKYCYELKPVTVGSLYLIRATFLYGNYDDSASQLPISFDLLLDAELWSPVVIETAANETVFEVYVPAQSTSINVCLARSGLDNPFISTLELRPLSSNMLFTTVQKGKYLLYRIFRLNYGTNSSAPVRYPDDKFDRIWDALIAQPSLPMSTEQVVTDLVDAPPSKVMMTAFGGRSRNLYFTFDLPGTHSYFIVLYFAETYASAGAVGQRVFNIRYNGQYLYGPLDVYKVAGNELYKAVEIYTPKAITIKNSLELVFSSVEGSVLGPLLNAIEILRLSEAPFVESTFGNDVEALADIKDSLNLSDWTGDPCLPSMYKYDWVNCSSTSPPRIVAIELSKRNLTGTLSASINLLSELTQIALDNNNITGPIPDLTSLTKLQKLDLQSNDFNGTIPNSLATLPSLSELLLQNNNFSGVIPQSLLQKSSNFEFRYDGNKYLCEIKNSSCFSNTTNGNTQKRGMSSILIIVVVVVCIIGLSGLFGGFCYWSKWKRRSGSERRPTTQIANFQSKHGQRDANQLDIANHGNHFTFDEVKVATNNFSEKIGEGGFGKVFHGVLANGDHIAVKILSQNSSQGLREFLNEVSVLSRVHHKNLVSLSGYCNDTEYILIYEYMSEGALSNHLYGKQASSNPLSWKMRLHIALDAAEGLAYLHTGCLPSIIHRDVKSSNILLNDKFQAKVADFGLSKLKPHDNASHVSTAVMGTMGYLDPEYYKTLQLTDKSDVYSFGVVLLEIICGRPPVKISLPPKERNIVEWVRPCVNQGNIEEFIDPALGKNYNMESVWRVVETAIRSAEALGENRPTMVEVVADLKEALKMESEEFGAEMNDFDRSRGMELYDSDSWNVRAR